MNVQVIYSSLSGCTRRLAEGIFAGLAAESKSIHDLNDGQPELTGDMILLGYWVDKGGPNAEMRKFMESVQWKKVGVFCTLAYWADSAHAHEALHRGVELVRERNTVIGGYVCNGAMSPQMIAAFRANTGGPHSATPASEARWDIMKNHPTACEIALAAERFNERIELSRRLAELGVPVDGITI